PARSGAAQGGDRLPRALPRILGAELRAPRRSAGRAEIEIAQKQEITMKNTGTLKVTTRGDREIVLERVFDAPPELVWEAMTNPELVKKWYGPHGHNLVVCEIDFRVGGKWRYVLRGPTGKDMGQFGEYLEIDRPDRFVATEGFDDFPGVATNTLRFV